MCILILSLIHHRAFFWPHLFFNELIPINTQQKAVCAHYEWLEESNNLYKV